MCGIVGFVGAGTCRDFVVQGLSRLEYRGYDSAGFVCIDDKHGHLDFVKVVGRINALKSELAQTKYDGRIGIGHTRWATHGIADQANAHPHFNCQKSIAVVHNGIIEGYEALRDDLIAQGHEFYSATDTEVMVHLFSLFLDSGFDLKHAVIALAEQLQGAFASVFLLEKYPDTLIAMRRRSPLAIGIDEGQTYVASDPMVFSDCTDQVIFMPEQSFALVTKDKVQLFDFAGRALTPEVQKLEFSFSAVTKQGHDTYYLKEMYEQKQAIDRTISFYRLLGNRTTTSVSPGGSSYEHEIHYSDAIWQQLGITAQQVRDLKSLHMTAAGTSWHAGRIGQFFFENVAHLPTRVNLASEFRYMPYFKPSNAASIFITQSGETADTLEALRMVQPTGIPTIALTNVASSTIVREADGSLLMQAGPEISVCSTKAFSSQLASLYWLAHRVALERGVIEPEQLKKAEDDIYVAAEVLESSIESYKYEITSKLAQKYAQFDRFIFLGRNISYPFAMEAALKLKEASYIFAQCYPAGELKHGPIALIDEHTPVVICSLLDDLLYQKLIANAQEVKARKGHLIVFAFEGQTELINLADTAFVIPHVAPLLAPLAMTGLMQYFVYEITKQLGRPIDKPRNLAKSVTVE